ncbi:hypothetical protein C1645_735549 [Glomus cerebriforme]|uniref:Uncharacterized protein n=1 Tax=Glomus cerebriforme TaxID=658196 RepID=A0A397T583_9GLOM|nr:hypothetical protein C1645_735549 [Glomus cerebriforme]
MDERKKEILKEIYEIRKQIKRKGEEIEEKIFSLIEEESKLDWMRKRRKVLIKEKEKIEQKEWEEMSFMSWEDSRGENRRKEKKKEIQEEIKELKEERNERWNTKTHISHLKEKLVEVEGILDDRFMEIEEEANEIQEEIDRKYDEIKKLYL